MEDFLTWPVTLGGAAATVGIAALCILRPALMRLLDRTKRVGKEGAIFEQESTRTPSPQPVTAESIMTSPTTVSLLERERAINENLRQIKEHPAEEQWKVMVRLIAYSRLELEYSEIGLLIFGSQLNLLVAITSGLNPVPLIQAQRIFAQGVEQYPAMHKERSFQSWLSFLQTHRLVNLANEQVEITQYGSDFLKFLVDKRRTQERPG